MMKRTWVGLALAVAASAAFAQATPHGLWRTVDDESGKEKSLIRITDNGGVLTGRVEKLLDPAKQDATCDKCPDARKGQPILGMTIVENVRRSAGEAYWDGGTILDPNNGKSYKVRLTPKDGGRTLDVRGYLGTPMLGRTQTWQRVE